MFFFQLSLLWAFSSLTLFHTLPARAHDFFELCLPPGLSHYRVQLLVLGASSSLGCLVDRLLAKSAKSSFHTAFLKPPPCPRSRSLSLSLFFLSFLFFFFSFLFFLYLFLSFFSLSLSLSLSDITKLFEPGGHNVWKLPCLICSQWHYVKFVNGHVVDLLLFEIRSASNCRRWRRGGYLGLFQPLFVNLFNKLMRRILPLAQKYDCSNRRCW